MNLTNEQIEAVIAATREALQSLNEPGVYWVIFDKDGDFSGRFSTEALAREEMQRLADSGHYAPYSLYYCEEVCE